MADINDIQLRIIVHGTGLDNLNRLNDTLAKSTGLIGAAGTAGKNAGSQWRQFGDDLSHLEQRFDAVFRAASHLQALGRDLTGMGQAGLGMLRESVDAWGEYEFSVHRAAGALGIFDTQSPIFAELTRQIDETAQSARLFPAEEIAKAVYFWGSATGQTVNNNKDLANVMDGLLPIMQTAAITETDYETAIKGTYQIIQQYKLGLTRLATEQDVASGAAKRVGEEMSNTRDITEKLMMITQNTAVEYSDLIEAFKYTGSVAPALGVTYEELAVVLGRLGDLGIRGSTAGRALQQTFTKLLDPTVRASNALNDAWEANFGLGKSFNDMVFPNGEFIGLAQYVDQLADVTEDMTMKERGNLIAIMTTQNELRTMIPLVEDQIAARKSGISVYDQEKYALENASKQFEQTMHLLEISWKGTMGYLRESIMPVVRLIGAEVARMATPFVEAFGKIIQVVKSWLDTHPEIVKWIVQIVAVASVIAIMAGAVFTALGVIMAFGAGIGFVIGKFMLIAKYLPRLFPILGFLTVVITALATNFGGLRDAAVRVGEGIMAVWDAMNKDAAGAGIGTLERLGQVILPMLERMAEGAAWVLERIADILEWIARTPAAVKVVEGMVSALGLFMVAGFVSRIAGIAFSIMTLGGNALGAAPYVKMLASSMSRFFSISSLWPPKLISNFKNLNAALSMTASDAKGKFIKAISVIKTTMTGLAVHTKAVATGISLSIKSVLIASGIGLVIVAIGLLYEAWTNNWGDIQGKFAAAVDWISARFKGFVGFFVGLWDDIKETFDGVVRWLGMFWTAIQMRAYHAINAFVSFWKELPGRVGQFVSELVTNVTTWLSTMWTNVTTWIGNIVTTIIEFPGKAWDGLVGAIQTFFDNYNAWWDSMGVSTNERLGFILGFVWTWAGNMIEAFLSWLVTLPGLVADWFNSVHLTIQEWAQSVWNTIVEWGANTLQSFVDWVTSVWDTVTTWFQALPGHIWNFLQLIWQNFTTWFATTWTGFTQWVTNVWNTVSTWFAKLPGRVMEFMTQLWNNVSAWFGTFISNLGTWASNAITAVIDWIQKLPGRVMEWMNRLFDDVSRWFGIFKVNAGIWASNAIDAVIDWFIKLPGKAMDAVNDLTGLLRTFLRELPGRIWSAIVGVGTNIVNGVRKGISDAWSGLVNWFSGLFTGMAKGADLANQSHSPSRVYMGVAKNMMDGLRLGIEKNDGAVVAMENQVGNILAAASGMKTGIGELGTNFAFSTADEKRLVIEHRVSSPDGTVNGASQSQLREIFTAEEFVSALEHMATVG